MLSASTHDDLLDPNSWKKSPGPVFYADGSMAGTLNAGHNSFFKSPDGTEDWILYHANEKPGQGCGRFRSPRAQKFTWKEDGVPDFGTPVSTKQWLAEPSR
jgi:GH43 family beta-xylosidase